MIKTYSIKEELIEKLEEEKKKTRLSYSAIVEIALENYFEMAEVRDNE